MSPSEREVVAGAESCDVELEERLFIDCSWHLAMLKTEAACVALLVAPLCILHICCGRKSFFTTPVLVVSCDIIVWRLSARFLQ